VAVEPRLAAWAQQGAAYFNELRAKCGCSSVAFVAAARGSGAGGRVEMRSDEAACVRRAAVLLQSRLEHQAGLAALEAGRERLAHDLQGYEQELASGLRCEFEVPNEVLGLIIGKAGANVRECRAETGAAPPLCARTRTCAHKHVRLPPRRCRRTRPRGMRKSQQQQ